MQIDTWQGAFAEYYSRGSLQVIAPTTVMSLPQRQWDSRDKNPRCHSPYSRCIERVHAVVVLKAAVRWLLSNLSLLQVEKYLGSSRKLLAVRPLSCIFPHHGPTTLCSDS